MIVQTVTFVSALPEADVWEVCRERLPDYRAVPGLIQKYYTKLAEPGTFSGVLIWESAEALAAFRETDLARSIPAAYAVIGTPKVEIRQSLFQLRDASEAADLERAMDHAA